LKNRPKCNTECPYGLKIKRFLIFLEKSPFEFGNFSF